MTGKPQGSSEGQQQEDQTNNEVKDTGEVKGTTKDVKELDGIDQSQNGELITQEVAAIEETITKEESSEQQEQIETNVNGDQTDAKQNGLEEVQESNEQKTDQQSEEDKDGDIEVTDIIDNIVKNILENKTESQSVEMPEQKEAIPQSPTLQRAIFRYRWAQTIPTASSDVYFYLSTNKDDGVKLSWTESASCYYSEELDIPIGIYNGELVVDDKPYPIEDINIKHYTFEADIFVKDDDTNNNIEEEANQQISDTALADFQTTKMEDGSESPIHLSNKYEELVRQQLSQKALELDVEDRLSRSQKSDHSSGRHTPIGDVAIETYQDGDTDLLRSGNRSFNKDSLENSLVEDEVERSSVVRFVHSSVHGSGHQTPQDLVQDILENDLRRTPVKSPGSSARQTPSQIDVMAEILGSEQRATPLRSAENSFNGSGIHTPVRSKSGDEFRSPVGSVHNSVHSSARHTPLVDDVLDNAGSLRSGQNSLHSSARQTPQSNLINDIINQQQSSPARSEHSGSARHTPQSNIINDYINEQRASPVKSEGSARQTPQADLFNDVLNRSTPIRSEHSGSARQTPQPSNINDVLQQQRSSPARSGHSGSVYGSNRQTPQPQSEHSSARQTPTSHREMISDALRLSQERLYGSQGPASHHSGSSRPQSLTSEQELTQYFEQNSIHSPERSSSKQTPIGKLPSATERLSAHSTSSLPVITTQQRLQAEKRSMTPENHVRVPGAGSPVVRSSSAANRSAASSRASTRTLTPTSANGMMETGQKEEEHLQRIQDLEDSVRNLRKLLSSREMEVHELNKQLNDFKDLNKSLRSELEHVRSRKSPSSHYAELELKNKQLIEEKEILSAEVVKLQDLVDELRKGRETVLEGGRDGESSSIRHYQPNNPEALMKKIAELESHIQDLQEANESAMAEVNMSDRKLQLLLQENGNLKNTHSGSVADLEVENKRLHDKISKLYEEGYGDFDHKTRVETQQLRDDNRALRERNYKLHEENLKFKEELELSKRTLERTNVQSASQQRGELSSRMLSMGLASTRLEVERSYDSKLASELKTSDKMSSRERLYKDDDRLMTSSLDRHDNRFRSSLEKDDHRYQSLDREPGRLKASDIYQRKDREYRSNLDKKETKHSYESYERLQPRLDQETEKSLLDRSFERMKYDYEELGSSRSDAYRPRPDGGSTEKEHLGSSLKYEKSLDRPYDNDLLGYDRSKKDYYGKDYSLTDGTRRLSLDRDYKSSYEPRRESKSADRSKDKEQRRPGPSVSDRIESSQSLLGLSDRYSKTAPTPYTSYKHDDIYDRELSKSYKSHSKPPVVPSYLVDPGEVSDTATDILVNAQPFEKMSPPDTYSSQQYDDHNDRHSRHHSHYTEKPPTTQNRYDYRRRREMASAGSDSSPSDVEDQFGYSLHQRSKSADGRELRGMRTAPTGGMTRSNTGGGRRDETTRLSLESGFRSVTPSIIKTQHNKNLLTTTSGSLQNLTSGMRPFAPRSPGDINIEDVVKFSRQGGKLSQGEVKYIGHLPGRSDVYLGIELDKEDGKHDGKFEGNRYFRCKPNKGVFVAFNKVVMAWSPI